MCSKKFGDPGKIPNLSKICALKLRMIAGSEPDPGIYDVHVRQATKHPGVSSTSGE